MLNTKRQKVTNWICTRTIRRYHTRDEQIHMPCCQNKTYYKEPVYKYSMCLIHRMIKLFFALLWYFSELHIVEHNIVKLFVSIQFMFVPLRILIFYSSSYFFFLLKCQQKWINGESKLNCFNWNHYFFFLLNLFFASNFPNMNVII